MVGGVDRPDPAMTVGQRIQLLRERRGMTRAVLAGLVGRSESWVKAVEKGRLQVPRLPMLIQVAEVLRLRNLAELTGNQSMPVRMFTGPGHPALAAVRGAINTFPLRRLEPLPNVQHVRLRLARAWAARHASPDHRTVLGGLLPKLIEDAQGLASFGEDRRSGHSLLAEVLNLSQMFLAYQPDGALLWRAAERAMLAAQESESPEAIAGSVWFLAQAHRDAGDFDAARDINVRCLEYLEPLLADGEMALLAWWGALQFEVGYTAARAGDRGGAWRRWDDAERTALRLPGDYYHPVTSFSRVIMGAHAVTVGVELRQAAESVRQADRTVGAAIPSRPRRGHHLIEVARAYHLHNDPQASLAILSQAHDAAPETIRYNGYARRILLEMVTEGRGALRRSAAELAAKIDIAV